MGDKTKHLVRVGHELASELKADCGAVDMRSVANLLAELASALDVQTARSDALAVKLTDVCAENAALKHAMAVTMEHVSVMDTGQAGVAAMIINDALHNSETPATDAWVNEQRVVGADLTKQQIEAAIKSCYQDEQIGLIEAAEIAGSFAAQLRGGRV